ncbi:MAG: hypothetical protein PHX78_05530, partial [bacterium]|nr:hypothetical protein [bacterium]
MEDLNKPIKAKKEIGFHNFFLGAILFHLVLIIILNINKVSKLDVAKEAYLKFTMIKLPPSPEAEPPKEEIQPQKTEVKVDAPNVQQTDVPKASMEVEEIKPMDAVQVEERDLLRDRLGGMAPPAQMEGLSGGEGGIGTGGGESDLGGGANIALPSSFGRPNEGSSESRGPAWGSGGGSGGGSGSGSGGKGSGFGGKKDV